MKMNPSEEPSVLIVDEEPSILLLASAILQRNGIRTLLARTCADAVRLIGLDAVNVDMVLANEVMPEMKGSELVSKLCEIRPNLRVLYMSAFADGAVLRMEARSNQSSKEQETSDTCEFIRAVRSTLDERQAVATA